MNNNTQKALVHSSLEALKRAALNVLYEERDKKPIRQDIIRMRLGIPKIDYSLEPARHNALIFGILKHLEHDKYADHISGYGWQINKEGIKVIENYQ